MNSRTYDGGGCAELGCPAGEVCHPAGMHAKPFKRYKVARMLYDKTSYVLHRVLYAPVYLAYGCWRNWHIHITRIVTSARDCWV
jgi:hypothetical protein